MMKSPFGKISKIRNNLDSTHCLQFSFMAALETLGGPDISVEEAERATGYQPGGTWPFTMLTWFARNGFLVKHIENTNFERFISDTRAELFAQGLDAETVDLFFDISDFDAESRALQAAMEDPRVTLESRLPVVEDITHALDQGWLPMVSLDSGTLAGEVVNEFDGHMVLATAYDDAFIRFQDPGPPARWDWDASPETVLNALRTPSESSGTITLIRRQD